VSAAPRPSRDASGADPDPTATSDQLAAGRPSGAGSGDGAEGLDRPGYARPISDEDRTLLALVRTEAFRDWVDGRSEAAPTDRGPTEGAVASGRGEGPNGSSRTFVATLLFLLAASMIGWPMYVHERSAAMEAAAESRARENLLELQAEMMEELSREYERVEDQRNEAEQAVKRWLSVIDHELVRFQVLIEQGRIGEASHALYNTALLAQQGEPFEAYLREHAHEVAGLLDSVGLPEPGPSDPDADE